MSGNTFEWCADMFVERLDPQSPARRDAAGSGPHVRRAVRGGGFASVAHFVRAGFRGRFAADHRSADVGFRLCKSMPAAKPKS